MAATDYSAAARQYAEQVIAGEILTCKWVQRACQRQLDDLAKFKGKSSAYRFNPKLTDRDGRTYHPGENLCAFIERLPHVKGPLAGEAIKLEPWQVFILSTVFVGCKVTPYPVDFRTGPDVGVTVAYLAPELQENWANPLRAPALRG